jgi:hypothetical protein
VAPLGLSRAKLYAFHAAIATGVATGACGGSTATLADAGSTMDAPRSGDATGGDSTPADSTAGDSTAADSTAGDVASIDASEGGAQDASADAAMVADAGTDQGAADAGANRDGWGPPPPPYGCVFPEGCGEVKV